MAETFLSPVIEKLLDLLIEEARSLKGVGRDVESLKDELEIIQPFLRDAEAKSDKGEVNDAAKVWLKQIRKQAERIEDVVDEYLYHLKQHPYHGGFLGSLRKAGQLIKSLKLRHDLASEVQDIQKSLREIKDRGVGYGLRPLEEGSSSRTTEVEPNNPRLKSLFMEDDEIIGIDGASTELIRRLIAGPSMRSVTSLVGQGGIGKTTLARKVYNDEGVKAHFDCHAWITVSQSYDMNRLLRILIWHVCGAGERIREDCPNEELITFLRQHLQTKRYMFVFDDVWRRDFWEVMKHALPNKDKGSRIVITTRNVAVATSCNESFFDHVQELQTWSSEMAWMLFCKKAFRTNEGHCPQKLEQLSREIIDKCQGLPLAISAIAGLLSTKEKVYFEWRKVLDDLNSDYEKTGVLKILSLSYLDLPYHLKVCFLYFAIYPEDTEIRDRKLCKLWIAEGFVKARMNKTLEEVAKEYMDELIHRNLVLFYKDYGVERRCRVHDLMYDIIVTRAGELCFCQTLNESKSKLVEKSHRLSIYDATTNVLERVRGSKIRTVFLFHLRECTKSFLIDLFEKCKLLKVLDFPYAPIDNLPKEVGNLFHLKYLSLVGANVRVLPKSIGRLQNLQTLNLQLTLVRILPVEIRKLKNLRHLLTSGYDNTIPYCLDSYTGARIGEGIGRLEELQTLFTVEAYNYGRIGFVKELQKLKKLKVLGVTKISAAIWKDLGASVGQMNQLEEFFLTAINEDEAIDLKYISSPPPFLSYLQLNCRLQQLPNWISELYNLQGLELNFSRLIDEPLKYLKGLPNLAYLRMYKTYGGEELHFEEGGFQKLNELKILKLEGLKQLKIDKGALPLLERFVFGPSPLIKEMPSDVRHLTKLKSLRIHDMPREFVVSLQPNGGSDYWKIQHVPSVTFHYYKHAGLNFDRYKLGSSDLLQLLEEQATPSAT